MATPNDTQTRAAEPGETTEIEIPGVLPTLNELVNFSKGHWAKYAKAKQNAEGKIGMFVARVDKRHECFYVDYTYFRPDRRTDPSNVHAGGEKVILDALEQCGIIAGDGHKHHRGSEYDVVCDENVEPQTMVTILERKS